MPPAKAKPPEPTPEDNARLAMKRIRGDVARIVYAWDPMALRGLRDWERNYDPQVPQLAVLVKKRAAVDDIQAALIGIMTHEWRMPAQPGRCRDVAIKLRRTGDFLDDEPGASPPTTA